MLLRDSIRADYILFINLNGRKRCVCVCVAFYLFLLVGNIEVAIILLPFGGMWKHLIYMLHIHMKYHESRRVIVIPINDKNNNYIQLPNGKWCLICYYIFCNLICRIEWRPPVTIIPLRRIFLKSSVAVRLVFWYMIDNDFMLRKTNDNKIDIRVISEMWIRQLQMRIKIIHIQK